MKDIDPLSSDFFDATKYPIRNILAGTARAANVDVSSVDILTPESKHEVNDLFSFGWKVNFAEEVPAEKGMDVFLQFMKRMRIVWEGGKLLRKEPENEALREKMIEVMGPQAITMLEQLMKVKGERTPEETVALTARVTRVRKKIDALKANGKTLNHADEVYFSLLEDLVSEKPQFTMPGEPSFNILFDIDPETGNIRSFELAPAMSAKGIAERLVPNTIYERAEKK